MSVLLIDNNDSFTYNIVEAIRSVCSDKWQIVRSEALDIGILDRFSHIVISPYSPMSSAGAATTINLCSAYVSDIRLLANISEHVWYRCPVSYTDREDV